MILKTSFKGLGMMKYSVIAFLTKLLVLGAWIYFAVIPYGSKFIELLNESLNSKVWNLPDLLGPVWQILLYGIGFVIIEVLVGLSLLFLAKNEMNNSRRW